MREGRSTGALRRRRRDDDVVVIVDGGASSSSSSSSSSIRATMAVTGGGRRRRRPASSAAAAATRRRRRRRRPSSPPLRLPFPPLLVLFLLFLPSASFIIVSAFSAPPLRRDRGFFLPSLPTTTTPPREGRRSRRRRVADPRRSSDLEVDRPDRSSSSSSRPRNDAVVVFGGGGGDDGGGGGSSESKSTTAKRNAAAEEDDDGTTASADPPPRNRRVVSSRSSSSSSPSTTTEEDLADEARRREVQRLLSEDEAKWKEERRRKMMGRYANATSAEDFRRIEREERADAAEEDERKAATARAAGVTLTVLAPPPDDAVPDPSSSLSSSDVQKKNKSWFDDVDRELEAELAADVAEGRRNGGANGDEGDDDDDDFDGPTMVNGKMVSREQLRGVRVGSAGGWSLEVFPGDFVVHRKYGIGRFEKTVLKPKTKLTADEIEARDVRRKDIVRSAMTNEDLNNTQIRSIVDKFGTADDPDPISNPQVALLEIAYSDAIVHVPVERAYRLSRYRSGDAAVKPRLSRAKGEAWSKARSKVEQSAAVMAQDVLALYATRETLRRTPYDPTVERKVSAFEGTFPFVPTPDQIACFESVENDMVWRSRPMDRLICGDVGFGKTEVALRALYRCVANGRQAALLAPTGVLSAQHFKNVCERMGEDTEFGVNVSMLRGGMGKNTRAGRELRSRIASGDVDLIVGTHALLSNGLAFKDLGLLVVDEEQRFGVKQKERLKLICNGVDVLTLSATPIPRTLQMSLSGIRDTTTIRSPPPMRKPTRTFVQTFHEDVVREAIRTETDRGGQCYYVLPRIAQLEEAEKMIRRLFPDLRIVQAHGRMNRGGAEENVASFAEGNYDVLLATTVIENGVDIPTVNTIIVQNAQAFGMSTLYQLRGRVGRSAVQAYAYFLHKEEAITEQSAMRLQAMSDLHELGCGFDVANRDLEIRGAGSLLGTEQSGLAAKVGFDLYMRMLKKSIRKLRGLDLPIVPRTNVLMPGGEGSIEVSSSGGGGSGGDDGGGDDHAFRIPKNYVADAEERLKQEGAARLAESTSKLVELTNLWKETYGPLPGKLQSQLKTLHLHACTRQLGIDLVGLIETPEGHDCVLRSPGLRPRHWAQICPSLPRSVPTKGLDVIFPGRFCPSGDELEIEGGKKVDFDSLLLAPRGAGGGGFGMSDDDEEEWDALDEEESEAMKEISSASKVRSVDDVDVERYPRFVVKNFDKVKRGSRVDALLKLLLPASKVVYETQTADKEKAKVAAELREKRMIMKKQKKEQESRNNRRSGYAY